MTATLQGIIIALLIGLLIGIIVGHFLGKRKRPGQPQMPPQDTSQDKGKQQYLSELEHIHDERLQELSQRLRQDYEAELATTIAHYQDELSTRTQELQQAYETRLQVIQQGITDAAEQQEPAAEVMPKPEESPAPTGPSEEDIARLKQKYEARLKEAAQKLQKAYEKQLAQHVKSVKADLNTDYEQRLDQATERLERQFANRQTALEQEYHNRQADLENAHAKSIETVSIAAAVPPDETPAAGDDNTVTLAMGTPPAAYQPDAQITQADLDARIQQATQQIREDYEQQLSSKLKEYRDQVTSRVRELEDTYQNKLNALAGRPSSTDPSLSSAETAEF